MPLRAHVNDADIIAPLLDDNAWSALCAAHKAKSVSAVLPCCGAVGYPRTNKLGTRHFVHASRDSCTWAPETAELLSAKRQIVIGCVQAGYTVQTEAVVTGMNTDVVA